MNEKRTHQKGERCARPSVRSPRSRTAIPAKRLLVEAVPQDEIDPQMMLSLLLVIAEQWERGSEPRTSMDTFDAAIEDHRPQSNENTMNDKEVS